MHFASYSLAPASAAKGAAASAGSDSADSVATSGCSGSATTSSSGATSGSAVSVAGSVTGSVVAGALSLTLGSAAVSDFDSPLQPTVRPKVNIPAKSRVALFKGASDFLLLDCLLLFSMRNLTFAI